MAKFITKVKKTTLFVSLTALSAAVGCSDGGTFAVDPEVASQAAMEQYDKNGDALLDETELKASPALQAALRAFDESKDKKLSREEIAEQIDFMYQRVAKLTTLDCTVYLDGGPLAGATVKFIPEKFLGEEIKTAEGITNQSGNTSLSIPTEDLPKELRRTPALRAGIYRVEITHPTKKVPTKYNTETELGFDFHATDHIRPPTFNLASN